MSDKPAQPLVSKPPTQLPKGPYPASRTTIWLVAALVLINCAVLALGIPGR